MAAAPPTAGVQRPQNSSDVQALTPQIDRTFIDRIVEMSATNTTFRQELTRSMVLAKVAAVDTASRVDHYQQLLTTLKSGGSSSLTTTDVERRLVAIVADGKDQVRQFGLLYDEFSRVSLRSGPLMYRVERPAEVHAIRSFTTLPWASHFGGLLQYAVLCGHWMSRTSCDTSAGDTTDPSLSRGR